MKRKHVTWIGLVAIAAAMVLHTSTLSRQQEDRLADLNRQIATEEDRIRVLTAEWHSLKTPERLEQLAKRHMPQYIAIKPTQMASLFDVPERAAPALPAVAESKPATPEATTPQAAKPVQVAKAQPTATSTTPAKPVQQVAAVSKPAPQADEDDVARLIAADDANNDGIRTIIERDSKPAANGVLWANYRE